MGAVEGRGPGQAWAGDGEQRAQQDEGRALCLSAPGNLLFIHTAA